MTGTSAMLCAGMLTAVLSAGASAQSMSPAPAAQPAARVEGTYEFKQSVMTEPGGAPIDVVAKLELRISGDSASGTWLMTLPGREAKPVALRGTVKGNTVTLMTGTQQAHLQGQDGERTIDISQEYVLTITGDNIAGSIIPHSSDENVQLPERALTGKRVSVPPASGSPS